MMVPQRSGVRGSAVTCAVSWAAVLLPLRRELASLIALAAPLVLAQVAQTGLGLVDTLMAGRLGGEALAGIALGATFLSFVLIVSSGVLFSVSPLVAQAFGAREPAEAGAAARQGLWLAVVLAVPGIALFWVAEPLLLAMGQQPAAAELAADYLRWASFGLLPALLLTAFRGFLEGVADPRPIMVILVSGVGLNALADHALMFGAWGFPALGLVGTGVATSIVYTAMAVAAAAYIAWRHRAYGVFRGLRRPDGRVLGELFRVGWPIGMTLAFEAGLFTVVALLMGLFGTVALAAHQIAQQSVSTTFMIPLGLATATAVRVGHAAGRGDPAGTRMAAYAGIGLASLVMVSTSALYLLAPRFVIGLFLGPDPGAVEVVRQATVFLAIAASFQIFDGIQVTALGALRGLKDTRAPMVISFVSYWGIGVPVGVALAFAAGWRGAGLWWGLVFGLGTASVLLALRLRHQLRRRDAAAARTGPPVEGPG